MSVARERTFAIWVRGFALSVRVKGSWELSRQGSAPVAPPPAHRSGVRPDDRPRRRWSEARSSGRWPEVRVTPQRVRKTLLSEREATKCINGFKTLKLADEKLKEEWKVIMSL